MKDEKGQDDKILCVPLRDPASSHLLDLDDLRPSLLAEIEHFFAVYKDLEDKKVETQGFQDLSSAGDHRRGSTESGGDDPSVRM
jgi:inorganic pyrophosphatase